AACMDHPGIVHRISGVLSQLGVNIESMETKTYSAPMSGTPLFQLEAELAVPVRTNINQLRERLADVQRDENIDIEITVIKGETNLCKSARATSRHVPWRVCQHEPRARMFSGVHVSTRLMHACSPACK